MNENNWREVIAALDQITARTGGEFWNERVIALTRAGNLGGRAAVEEFLEKDRLAGKGFGTSSQVFEGWASMDPAAAWEWMRQSGDESLRRACLVRFAWGMAAADPSKHFDYFRDLTDGDKLLVAVDATRALLQTEGFPAADRLLSTEAASDAGENATSLHAIFDVIARQRRHAVQNGANPEEACQWFAANADKPFVSSEQFRQMAALLATSKSQSAAAEWMASVYTANSARATGPALTAAIKTWAAGDPNAAGEWLRGQSRHPGYQAMVSGFVAAIAKDDPEAAAAWQKTVE
ncbi:MAG TPA: hypothetical protein VG796_14875 [Verrucomicrobiales bacterium]|nr:hypothetical protein [Verrucomicrobiales bacterium]